MQRSLYFQHLFIHFHSFGSRPSPLCARFNYAWAETFPPTGGGGGGGGGKGLEPRLTHACMHVCVIVWVWIWMWVYRCVRLCVIKNNKPPCIQQSSKHNFKEHKLKMWVIEHSQSSRYKFLFKL